MLQGKTLSKIRSPATEEDREVMNRIPYASAIGSIMYAILCTRPDVAHAISLTSRYQSDPGLEHWTMVKNIFKYLRRTKDMFLVYGREEELMAKCYIDDSFDSDPDNSKSQSGYIFVMNRGAVLEEFQAKCGSRIIDRGGICCYFISGAESVLDDGVHILTRCGSKCVGSNGYLL
jgi:hypothetical protein